MCLYVTAAGQRQVEGHVWCVHVCVCVCVCARVRTCVSGRQPCCLVADGTVVGRGGAA